MKFFKIFIVSFLVAGLIVPDGLLAETVVRQNIETGFQQKDVNSPEAKFEEYRDVPNGVFIERYELDSKSETSDLNIELNKITQEDESAFLEFNKGRLGVDASWNQTPHLFSNTAQTPYSEFSDGFLGVPDRLRSDLQGVSGSTLTAYGDALQPAELKTRTDKGAVAVNYVLSEGLTANLAVSETIKKGHQTLGASFTRSHVVNIAQPIDQKTYDSSLGIGFSGKTFQWNAGYDFSSFQNDLETITWENPKRLTDSTSESSQGRLNAAPDNSAHFFNLNGGLNLPAKTRFTADVNVSYMRQNEALLPYTINSSSTTAEGTNWNSRSLLPTDKADATVVTWNQDYKVTNNLFNFLNTQLRYHSTQIDNRTPEYTFSGSAGLDFNYSATDTNNLPFEMRKDTLGGSLDVEVLKSLNFGLSYDFDWIKREHREVKESEEGRLGIDIDYKPCSGFLMRGTYENARRRLNEFEVADLIGPSGTTEMPGMRRYDVSDRDRNDGNLLIQMASNKYTVGLRGSMGYDKYKPGEEDLAALSNGGNAANLNTMYGLLDSRRAGAGIDVDAAFTEQLSLFTFYDYSLEKEHQRSNYNSSGALSQDAANDWDTETIEKYHTAGLGVNADIGKVVLTLGCDISQSKGSYDFVAKGSGVQTKVDPDETKTTKQDYYVQANMPVSDVLTFGLGYVFEKYDVYDWASNEAPTVNSANFPTNELYLGDASQDYKAHIVTAKVNYKF